MNLLRDFLSKPDVLIWIVGVLIGMTLMIRLYARRLALIAVLIESD